MTHPWIQSLHTFKCGPCGTMVSGLLTLAAVKEMMEAHAPLCPGFSPASATATVPVAPEKVCPAVKETSK